MIDPSNHQISGQPMPSALILLLLALIVFGLISQLFETDSPSDESKPPPPPIENLSGPAPAAFDAWPELHGRGQGA